MDQNFINDLFVRCGVPVNKVITRTVALPEPPEATPIHEQIGICLKMLEEQQKSERWPSGISTFTINSYPITAHTEEYHLVEASASRILLQKASHPCPVCLELLKAGDLLRTLKCGHAFHKKCIDEWLKTKGRCPLDRQTML